MAFLISASGQQTAKDLIDKGDALFYERNYYAAINAYEEVIGVDPSNAEAWNRIGTSYSAVGESDKAIEAYDTAIQLDPTCSRYWNNKGIMFLQQGMIEDDMETDDRGIIEFEAAHSAFEKAVQINSTDAPAWTNKGRSLHFLGKYEEAIVAYEKAIRIDPRLVTAWANKGKTLRKQGKYNETIDAFNEAIRLDPSYKDYLGIYGHDSVDANGRSDEVRRYFEKAEHDAVLSPYEEDIKQDPKNITAWFGKARTLLIQGDAKNATQTYGEADIACKPDAIVWIAEGRRIIDSCEEAIRCFDRAIANCDGSIKKKSSNATAWNNKGVALTLQADADALTYMGLSLYTDQASMSKNSAHYRYRMDKREEGLKCFEKAIQFDPKCSTSWYNKGITLFALRDSYEEIEYYERILECFAKAESLPNSEDGCLKLEDTYGAKRESFYKIEELRITSRDVERVAKYR